MDFINEEFFKNVFKRRKDKINKNLISDKVKNILDFLKDNQIVDWNDFQNMGTFDREIVKLLINHDSKSQDDIDEVYFQIRTELSDKPQLKEYLKELENNEDYERCAILVKKLSKRK